MNANARETSIKANNPNNRQPVRVEAAGHLLKGTTVRRRYSWVRGNEWGRKFGQTLDDGDEKHDTSDNIDYSSGGGCEPTSE